MGCIVKHFGQKRMIKALCKNIMLQKYNPLGGSRVRGKHNINVLLPLKLTYVLAYLHFKQTQSC